MSVLAPAVHHLETVDPPLALPLLLDIAQGLAAVEDLWRPHAHHDEAERRPVRLVAADRWEAWVIGWSTGQRVELHDHGASAGALVVVQGDLVEITEVAGRYRPRTLLTGAAVELPLGLVHDVVATGPAAGDQHPRVLPRPRGDDLLRRGRPGRSHRPGA